MPARFTRNRKSAGVRVTGLESLLSTFNSLPKEINTELRKGSKRIADTVASDIRGWLGTAQAEPLLSKVRATNDRVPTIAIGGTARSGLSGGATRGELLGANFGANRAKQFPPKRKPDYYVFAAIKHRGRWVYDEWVKAVQAALASADSGVTRGA
jgi:hypothetical protein